jgi:hypothetical protein
LPVLESDNIRLMSPESGDGIRPPSPESGQLDSGDNLIEFWPDLAREVGSRPALASLPGSGKILPLSPESGYPRFRRNCPDSGLYLEFWLY